jgi:uncharacterized protein YneF (UPF0154 family)
MMNGLKQRNARMLIVMVLVVLALCLGVYFGIFIGMRVYGGG